MVATSLFDNIKQRFEAIPLTDNGRLNDINWTIAAVPLGNGNFWMYQDKNASVNYHDNSLNLIIDKFSSSHDHVQIFDNPKQLYLTKSSFKSGSNGLIGFSCKMKTRIINADPNDYREGFGAFNVLDFGSGMVFDIISNGSKLWIIYERLFMPGVTTMDQAFTRVIPINFSVDPELAPNCLIIYDKNSDRAEYYVDDQLAYIAQNIPVKVESFQTGFGFITLLPIESGKSVSCRGQGGHGTWSDFIYYAA